MQRTALTLGLAVTAGLALTIGVLSTSCTTDDLKPTAPSLSANREHDGHDDSDDHKGNDHRPVTYAVIGDVPYEPFGNPHNRFPTLINAINADPAVKRVIHIGDIKAGASVCSDQYFLSMDSAFTTFSDPLVYAIGDNEWTDCHRANNGGYNPLDRLAKLREIFFDHPGLTLGGERVRIKDQRGYPENQFWMASDVVFSAFHILGSNNGLAPWFADRVVAPGSGETAAESASREAEVAARDRANVTWLERTFEAARDARAKGIVLFIQADLWNPFDRALGTVSFSGHTRWVTRLAELATRFKRPVLIVAGDSHDYRVDAGVPWFSLYGVAPLSNVTNVIVDRSIEETTDASPINYVRLQIDPKSAAVFSWEQVNVP